MNIFLDTNIFREEFLLASNDFDVILDYLKKTDSKIFLPQVVLDELKALYKTELKNRYTKLKSASKNISLMLSENEVDFQLNKIDFEIEVNKYEKYILKRLNIDVNNILPYKNDSLPQIANRAIDRKKPSNEGGEGFRDIIIWITLLDFTEKTKQKQATFISSNSKDFANSKLELHEELMNECTNKGIKIHYFPSIREFIRNHSSKIEFINYEWLDENLNLSSLSDFAKDYLNDTNKSTIHYAIENETNQKLIEDYSIKQVTPYAIKEYFVYEMIDNKLHINVTVDAEVEIEYTYQEEYWDSRYQFFDRNITNDFTYIDVGFEVIMVLIDSKIEDISIEGVYI